MPISSRKSVPPCAASKRPARVRVAPVKAPASAPNSSLSMRSWGRAPALTLTYGPEARREFACTMSARRSLPGAVRARHEDRHVGGRDLHGEADDAVHRLALVDESAEVVALGEGGAGRGALGPRPRALLLEGPQADEVPDDATSFESSQGLPK